MGPDFSHVDSLAKAEQCAADGGLEPLLLLPTQFGGSSVPENIVYVPSWLARAKEDLDTNVIRPLIAGGNVTRYRATPEYQSFSFVPVALKIEAWEPGSFSSELLIWGRALLRPESPHT